MSTIVLSSSAWSESALASLQMDSRLRARFNVIFLFDVLEHVSDEGRFLEALLFHLAPLGKLVLNVPAGQWLWSKYDEADGHLRRYTFGTLQNAAASGGLRMREWTYWGLPLVPALMVRKLWLKGKRDKGEIISAGWNTRTTTINSILRVVSRCEVIPQKLLGTSLMAILERMEN